MSRLTGAAYQYLQRSKIATDKFQRSLPRLKIPKLEKTCQRYLDALEPIFAGDARLLASKAEAYEFFNCDAPRLHRELLKYDKTVPHTSYINEFWFDMYLSSRAPLPLNFNPFLAWRDANSDQLNDQAVRGANFLISAMRFKRSLEENVLEPEVFYLNPKKTSKSNFYKDLMALTPDAIASYVSFAFKAFPLDMSQYKNLFNSTRIPRIGKDEIIKSDSRSNRHVVVLRNGQFYTFDVLNEKGDLLEPEQIYANIKHIVSQEAPPANSLSITELTTAERDYWATERDYLIGLSEKNKLNLEKVDSAVFAICLDDITYEPQQRIEACHNFLHGAQKSRPLNRWFDKSFSIIITKGGHSCINFEHSWGDGVAILRFFNDTFNDSTKNPQIHGPIKDLDSSKARVDRLDFDLDNRLNDSILYTRQQHLDVTSNLELGAVEYAKLNKDYFKKNQLSPDAMSQLSFQLAYKKLYDCTPVTYESCSTAAFRGGRTETVRPCTNKTNVACEAIMQGRKSSTMTKSQSDLKVILQSASQKHYQLCKEASMGDGFDRHLFALKEMAKRDVGDTPRFFSDPLYLQSQHYSLSTSTLYGECFAGGGFAPVVPDGFGLGYGYVDANFGVLVSSYKDKRNNTQFVQALYESLDDIRKIIET